MAITGIYPAVPLMRSKRRSFISRQPSSLQLMQAVPATFLIPRIAMLIPPCLLTF